MIGVEQWAEIRRLYFVKRLSIKEIVRRTGHSRNTIRRALRSGAPSEYRRPPRPSKLDPFRGEVHGLLRLDPRLPGKRMRELLEEQGGGGSLDPLPGQRMTLAISTEVSPPTRPAGASPGRDRRAPRAHRLHALREGRRLSGREPTVRSTSRRACRGGRSSEPGRPAHAGPSRTARDGHSPRPGCRRAASKRRGKPRQPRPRLHVRTWRERFEHALSFRQSPAHHESPEALRA